MLKRSIAFALLAAAGHAYSADIEVTTTIDEDVKIGPTQALFS